MDWVWMTVGFFYNSLGFLSLEIIIPTILDVLVKLVVLCFEFNGL